MASTPTVSGVEGLGTTVKKGSAWISAKAGERSLSQQTLATDPKYKKYTQQVEKCLGSFDNVHEWADCIAFLKNLLKTFQTYAQFPHIPRKLVVAKRLAQCLNPALPTGVHQRALEVYVCILGIIGSEGVRRDLALWSAGLFPFFEYAATSVKPTLLDMYETYFIPLKASLRPIMKSFILALLPGLEEEGGEFFDKVLSLLDSLTTSVSPAFFFQNVWLVMLTTPAARGTAVNYLGKRLPKLGGVDDVTEIVGKDIGLMIRAFAAALEDDNLLVRRGTLDLLLTAIPLNSNTIRKAKPEDKGILMRAAIGVVLRRDISLNRRLYSWLLGEGVVGSGGTQAEVHHEDGGLAYFKEHALDLLHVTLKSEMNAPSREYSQSRPFKIFISLLDKWEIGGPLADELIYESFLAIKRILQDKNDGEGDLIMTASTLYEALEPEILWKPLLGKIFSEIAGESGEALGLALFIIKTFTHDDEIQTYHLPVIAASLLDFLQVQVQARPALASSPSVTECLLLLEELAKHMTQAGLAERPIIRHHIPLSSSKEEGSHPTASDHDQLQPTSKEQVRTSSRPYTFACIFYDIDVRFSVKDTHLNVSSPIQTSLDALMNLSIFWANLFVDGEDDLSEGVVEPQMKREAFSRTLALFGHMLKQSSAPVVLQWNPEEWMKTLLKTFSATTSTFTIIDRVTSLLIALHSSPSVSPRLSLQDRPTVHTIVATLLRYLRPHYVAYHARAVNLICALELGTKNRWVECVLAQSLVSPEGKQLPESYEAFGVLWRMTEDSFLPGFRFKVPMMNVLATLKSNDPNVYRVGETWMRCSLKSYLRLLDPILHGLLDPTILRTPHTFRVHKRELSGFLYDRPFDQRLINHYVETLLSIVGFAGQGFSKASVSTPVKRSHHGGLIERVEAAGAGDSNRSYMDVLIEALLRFIQSEPQDRWASTMNPLNEVLQSSSIQLLQMIVARGDVDQSMVKVIESIVIRKLYYFIHTGNLDLQNKLLHLLHSVISLSMANIDNSRRLVAAQKAQSQAEGNATSDAADDAVGYPLNQLLVQTLIDGVSIRSNRPIMQHWLDFILMAIPQFQPALQPAIVPLNECLCRQLRITLKQIKAIASHDEEYANDLETVPGESDLVMLINGLERLVLLGLAFVNEVGDGDDDGDGRDKVQESVGLLGYVSGVFGGDGSSSAVPADQSTNQSLGHRSLDDGISVLYSIWANLIWNPPSLWTPREESLAQIYHRSRPRCRRALEHLFRVQSTEVFESIVDCWSRTPALQVTSPNAAFELVDVLVQTAQNAVHMLCESIANRVSSTGSRRAPTNVNLTDTVLFQFLEQYLLKLEGPLAVQVWPRYMQLVKELVGSAKEFKPYHFPAFRCIAVLSDKVTQTTAMDDKRLRKELQDNYGKLLDLCVAFVGRSSDQGSWIRRSTKENMSTNGRESPRPDGRFPDDKVGETTGSGLFIDTKAESAELCASITSFIASSALPNLRRYLHENDKVINTCSNIIYYVVNPAMRGKTRPMDVEPIVISIITEMTHVPTTLKSWRAPVVDLLADNRVFNSDPADGSKWRPIVKALYESDKATFAELIGKVAAAPSANIFTNKEYEMLLRSLNIRRLSYVLFSGDNNTFLAQLPTIQEKLVDVLRNITSPIVQSEVLLCIRVLLCRLSPNNLTSFWPVILTEIYRIFEQIIEKLPPDGSEDLQLVLAACKTIDLLLALQTQEFQVYQWIFVTDTIDAVYRPEEWFPEAMLDQLAEIAGSLPMDSHINDIPANGHSSLTQPPMRKPLLGGLRQIDSMRELVPFFSNVSLASYESVYASGGNVDWDAVENGLLTDMFDGR